MITPEDIVTDWKLGYFHGLALSHIKRSTNNPQDRGQELLIAIAYLEKAIQEWEKEVGVRFDTEVIRTPI